MQQYQQKLKGYAQQDTLIRQALKGTWEITYTEQIHGEPVRRNAFFDQPVHFWLAFGPTPFNAIQKDSVLVLANDNYMVTDSMVVVKQRSKFKIKKLSTTELVLQEYILNKGSRTQYTPGNLVGYFRRKP